MTEISSCLEALLSYLPNECNVTKMAEQMERSIVSPVRKSLTCVYDSSATRGSGVLPEERP